MKQEHSIPLTTAISTSTPGKGALAEALYNEAEALFFDKLTNRGSNVLKSRLTSKPNGPAKPSRVFVVARVVDFDTGFFIELSGTLDSRGTALTGPYLAYGKLYVSESKSPQLSNTQTKIWR